MFDLLKTGIDGLDAILGGGIRYPADTAAFVFVTGGAGSGKTMLALEMVTRAWLEGEDGGSFLFYSVEQPPESLLKKLEFDFEWYGQNAEIRVLEREVPHKLCLEARTKKGLARLVLTQANAANLQKDSPHGPVVDVDWIHAEIGNYKLAGAVRMVVLDNVGLLLTDLDYFSKRAALLETRRTLLQHKIHGIFVQEETDARDLRIPSAEEFSTDLLIRLSFIEQLDAFKARTIEILKARHQYYYRGHHHFSIAGRGVARDVYLGARNERGPGIHIYPSVPAQLSIARDRAEFKVPLRGNQPIDMGHPSLNAAFLHGTGPAAASSTVLLAEPGTRYTMMALRFLASGRRQHDRTLMVSTKEDQDALRRICAREPVLKPHCLDADQRFQKQFRVLYLHPEFISAGKFTWDILRIAEGGHRDPDPGPVARFAFDNIYRLGDRFPLITEQRFLIPALIDLLRYRNVTPLFIDLVPPGSARGHAQFDPSPYMTTFDNVLHLFLVDEGQEQKPYLRVLKSTANDFKQTPIPIDYRVP
jgi:KaiC/GvpD/RAD55 family RecA-like ATPase